VTVILLAKVTVYLLEMRMAILMELSLEPWLANYLEDLTGSTKDNSMGMM
jgi:hypothetical protein